ncbi:helix-turn-helix transcriptional regulator [Chryseobacterium sp. WG14]|uniref:helix-turn-helix transcriptional regulator n=1 Tax=Chryseobacterium sp. WG14 TaxID=2926909 RepID=UPI00211DC6BA|nr:helix-turn-helix transcriptional regulator [Chryseobacterium sp. WG14]MCQ9638587.1 helix-turn-helix transcriptional regulator [Chryseobacterium sp. WG14]
MIKDKLRIIRKQKGYTQQQVADFIATDVSNYSRKESGIVKIFEEEWVKIAKLFEVPVDEIYQTEIKIKDINPSDRSKIDYIHFLESEIFLLRQKLEALKEILNE